MRPTPHYFMQQIAVNIVMPEELRDEARKCGINISAVSRDAVREKISEVKSH